MPLSLSEPSASLIISPKSSVKGYETLEFPVGLSTLSCEYMTSPTSLKEQLVLDLDAREQLLSKTVGLKRYRSQHRGVSFAIDSNNNVHRDYIDSNFFLTEEDIKQLWWSREDILKIYQEARAVVAYYRKHRTDYTSQFNDLFAKCAKTSRVLREYGIVAMSTRRSARGLERHIHDVLTKYKSNFIGSLLEIQSKMPPEMDPQARSRLLAVKSCQLSKPSRNLAKFLAQQDSDEVIDQIRRELELSASFL